MSNNNDRKIALQKLLVGHFIESVPDNSTKKISYVWQGNGIWEIRKLALGTFTSHIHKFSVPGLKSTLEEGWILNVPKIPPVFLDVTVSFFRKVYNKYSSEVFLQYFYDMDKKEYVINCPQQIVGPGSVKYERNADYERGKIFVFEVHSHCNMGAFFSPIDNADEKDDRFFGVIGRVTDYYPQFKVRLSVGGRMKDVEIGDIFNLNDSLYFRESFVSEWVSSIKDSNKYEPYSHFSRSGGSVYYPARDEPYSAIDRSYFRHDDTYSGDGGFPPHSYFERSGLYVADDNKFNKPSKPKKRNKYKRTNNNILPDQELIEKDGRVYMVTNTNDREIWEEVDKTKKVVKADDNGGHKKDEEEDHWRDRRNWRNIKW